MKSQPEHASRHCNDRPHLARCRKWFADRDAARRAEPGYRPAEIHRTAEYTEAELRSGVPVFVLLAAVGLTESHSAARRLVKQGGATVNGRRVEQFDELVTIDDVKPDGNLRRGIILGAGKWRRGKIVVEEASDE